MDRDEHSYKRYKQYRRNKYRYEQEQITFPIAVILGLALFIRYWYIVVAVAAIVLAFIIFRKVRKKNVTKSSQIPTMETQAPDSTQQRTASTHDFH